MQGTEKQIKFANDLKAKFLAWVDRNIKERFEDEEIPQEALDKLEVLKSKADAQTDAVWWIENIKLCPLGDVLNVFGNKAIKLLSKS